MQAQRKCRHLPQCIAKTPSLQNTRHIGP
jgi:hypothetical protein